MRLDLGEGRLGRSPVEVPRRMRGDRIGESEKFVPVTIRVLR
jgi:hypothetical protein